MGLGVKEGSFFFKFFSRGESKSWQWRECWNKSPPTQSPHSVFGTEPSPSWQEGIHVLAGLGDHSERNRKESLVISSFLGLGSWWEPLLLFFLLV